MISPTFLLCSILSTLAVSAVVLAAGVCIGWRTARGLPPVALPRREGAKVKAAENKPPEPPRVTLPRLRA